MYDEVPSAGVHRHDNRPRVDLIVFDVVSRGLIADRLEQAGMRVIEHLPGVEVDFPGPRGGESDCIVIVHEPLRLDALVLTVRLRAVDIRSPILVLALKADRSFAELAALSGADLLVGPIDPDAVSARVESILAGRGEEGVRDRG